MRGCEAPRKLGMTMNGGLRGPSQSLGVTPEVTKCDLHVSRETFLWCPRAELNHHQGLRTPLFYPVELQGHIVIPRLCEEPGPLCHSEIAPCNRGTSQPIGLSEPPARNLAAPRCSRYYLSLGLPDPSQARDDSGRRGLRGPSQSLETRRSRTTCRGDKMKPAAVDSRRLRTARSLASSG